jgi:hypothetical protein
VTTMIITGWSSQYPLPPGVTNQESACSRVGVGSPDITRIYWPCNESLTIGTSLYQNTCVNQSPSFAVPDGNALGFPWIPSGQPAYIQVNGQGKIADVVACNTTTTTSTTSTTTTACECRQFELIASQADIDNATGNTNPSYNNTVYVQYYNCDDTLLYFQFGTTDPYQFCACTAIQPVYFKNNEPNLGSSTIDDIGSCS